MPDARDVILKHIAAFNDRDTAAEPWAADAELLAPSGRANGRDEVIGFLGVFRRSQEDSGSLRVTSRTSCRRRGSPR